MIPARTQNKAMPTPPSSQQSRNLIKFGSIPKELTRGQRSILYGTGGVGKTRLSCKDGKVAFVDADESLEALRTQLELYDIPLPTIVPAHDWKSLRTCLQSGGWDSIDTVSLDTGTKIEEWCAAYVLETVKIGGKSATSIEDYGYGKGFQFLFDEWLKLLGDLDSHIRAGRNVHIIAHECTCTVPNPQGVDWLRYEPRLYQGSSGKLSIRMRCKEWSDNTLFLAYDVNVEKGKLDKAGKAEGNGTRTLYTHERPFCMAKSRTCSVDHIDIDAEVNPWPTIYGKE